MAVEIRISRREAGRAAAVRGAGAARRLPIATARSFRRCARSGDRRTLGGNSARATTAGAFTPPAARCGSIKQPVARSHPSAFRRHRADVGERAGLFLRHRGGGGPGGSGAMVDRPGGRAGPRTWEKRPSTFGPTALRRATRRAPGVGVKTPSPGVPAPMSPVPISPLSMPVASAAGVRAARNRKRRSEINPQARLVTCPTPPMRPQERPPKVGRQLCAAGRPGKFGDGTGPLGWPAG